MKVFFKYITTFLSVKAEFMGSVNCCPISYKYSTKRMTLNDPWCWILLKFSQQWGIMTFGMVSKWECLCHAPPGARNKESRSPINNLYFTEFYWNQTNNIRHQTREKLRLKNTEESHEENWNRWGVLKHRRGLIN